MVKKFTEIKDSGKRQNFDTGSKRDTDEGKGNPHLIAGETFIRVKDYRKTKGSAYERKDFKNKCTKYRVSSAIEDCLWNYTKLVESREDNLWYIYEAIDLTCILIALDEDKDYYSAYTRLAIHYQNGAKKYDANNWRLGQPVSRYFDSANRHLWKLLAGYKDEDHYAALLWNLVAIVQTKIDVDRKILPESLNNYPYTLSEVFKNKRKKK